MNGLVSYSDEDEGTETLIQSEPQLLAITKEKTSERKSNQTQTIGSNSNSNLGIKKASSSTTSTSGSSTPIASNLRAQDSNSIQTSSPLQQSSIPRPQQLRVQDEFTTAASSSSSSSASQPSSTARLRALCFPPPRPINLDSNSKVQESEPSQEEEGSRWDHEWGLGEEATGQVDEALQLKLSNFHTLKSQGTHFNPTLTSSRAFRNPHIYAKLVKFVEVDERRSCYLEELRINNSKRKFSSGESSESKRKVSWNPMDDQVLREGSKDRLSALQKAQADERQKSQASGKRSHIDFTSSSSSASSSSRSNSRLDRSSSTSRPIEDLKGREKQNQSQSQSQTEAVKRALAARDSLGLKVGATSNPSQSREKDRDRGRDYRDRDRR